MVMITKENKKNKILEAAFSVFVDKGYSETTMDDIVKKSNMSKGAIYHYYNSKKEYFTKITLKRLIGNSHK